jgi:hypothetical protein
MTQALLPGRTGPRRRAMFGLLDADGWAWAGLKAFFWFIVIIILLGYLPDRAYYFTVNRTLDLGVLGISPINFCPPENEDLPCPAPPGGVLPWYLSPEELALEAPLTDAATAQIGTRILLIGGSNGETSTADVWVATVVDAGTYDQWQPGPALPEPRSDAGVAFLGGSVYVVGGHDGDGAPTDTTFVLTPDPDTGALGEWQNGADLEVPLTLPEPRAAAPLVALGDGLLLVGGSGPDGATKSVWKSTLDDQGVLGQWTPGAELNQPSTDGIAVQNGDLVWLYGGADANGPTRTVQRGVLSGTATAAGAAPEGGPAASGGAVPAPSASAPAGEAPEAQVVERWEVDQNHVTDLPEARTNAMGWAGNGALYIVGGNDGERPRGELYWTTPDPQGNFIEWHHLAQSDLPEGLEGSATLVSGASVFVIGGTTSDGVINAAARAGLAPQEPFFQLGLVGIVVPALKIDGEIGQQLGYLNAAGVGTINFVLLLVIGWAYANKERVREMWERARRRG